ncbi:hypothetical protein MMC12_004186 [Toensbergia leucococca]|nr:hypothetical protein [Toensbergia leucococca]
MARKKMQSYQRRKADGKAPTKLTMATHPLSIPNLTKRKSKYYQNLYAAQEKALSEMEEDTNSFPFMKLPVELRIMVYDEHLTRLGTLSGMQVGYTWNDESAEDDIDDRVPAFPDYPKAAELLLVCKAFYVEASPIFYRENFFHFGDVVEMGKYLESIPLVRRQQITRLSFEYEGRNRGVGFYKWFQLLNECTALRHLFITASEDLKWSLPWWMGEDRCLQNAYGIEYLLMVRGIEELQIDFLNVCNGLYEEDMFLFEERLQVLKEPRLAARPGSGEVVPEAHNQTTPGAIVSTPDRSTARSRARMV